MVYELHLVRGLTEHGLQRIHSGRPLPGALMKSQHTTHVVLGAGISGLLTAAVLARRGLKVTVLESRTMTEQSRAVEARDRHAHVCVGKAYDNLIRLIPEFAERATALGITIADPGQALLWSVGAGFFKKNGTGALAAFGSYKSFFSAVFSSVSTLKNVSISHGVDSLSIDTSKRIIHFSEADNDKSIRYEKLFIATGNSNHEAYDKVASRTRKFFGRCLYQSYQVKLSSPLASYCAFINDATPGSKPFSYLYVPRSKTSGVLTICNFDEKDVLKIGCTESMRSHLSQWNNQIPRDFIQKLEGISTASNYLSRDSFLRLSCIADVHFVGDASIKVTPYLGLGLLVATESAIAVDEHLRSGRAFESILERRMREVLVRMNRFGRLWDRQRPIVIRNRKLSRSPIRMIQSYLFGQALKTPIASRYLMRRFHLVEDSSPLPLLSCLVRVLVEGQLPKIGEEHERLSQTC